MKITSTNDGGVLIALSPEEVAAMVKASKQTDMFTEPAPLASNIYKGLRGNTRQFIDELRDKYDAAWIETKSEQFQDIRYRHRMTDTAILFRLLEERGGILSEREGGKYARVRFLW
jgi:hypothetical protein